MFRMRAILGNLEDITDYHSRVLLPRLEEAVEDGTRMRCSEIQKILHSTTAANYYSGGGILKVMGQVPVRE